MHVKFYQNRQMGSGVFIDLFFQNQENYNFRKKHFWWPKFYYSFTLKKIVFSKTSDLRYGILLASDVLHFFIFHTNLKFRAALVMQNFFQGKRIQRIIVFFSDINLIYAIISPRKSLKEWISLICRQNVS